ncbi:uncharacterized protein VTP21DRAFT_4049 [Calcarisporiella thermophila]|uniref:uncharacterized protein n=1 Tax=Calcarisporiella thermophila TaxID=911321 RepID=UPI0037425E20
MKASHHVDYLAHSWTLPQLYRCHRAIKSDFRRTKQQLQRHEEEEAEWNGLTPEDECKEWDDICCIMRYRALLLEYHHNIRLQNAVWRQWARLASGQNLVDPRSLNWAKDYDITWLLGPLYFSEDKDIDFLDDEPTSIPTTPVHSAPSTPGTLKPVLKRRTRAQELDDLRESALLLNSKGVSRFEGPGKCQGTKKSLRFDLRERERRWSMPTFEPSSSRFGIGLHRWDAYRALEEVTEEKEEEEEGETVIGDEDGRDIVLEQLSSGKWTQSEWNRVSLCLDKLPPAHYLPHRGGADAEKPTLLSNLKDLADFCVAVIFYSNIF